jgi:hypothetical protein
MSPAHIQQETTNMQLTGVSLSAAEVACLRRFAPGTLALWRQLAKQRISDETIAELGRILTQTSH